MLPLRDEEGSIPALATEIEAALESTGRRWECIWVDDGSEDGSRALLRELCDRRPAHRWIGLARGFGQSAALLTGLRAARGRVIATLDADGQNDPADIPRLLSVMAETGACLVNGVRTRRRDDPIRRLSSRIANPFRNWITGENVTDIGCALRVFRRDCADALPAFAGMHRFLPTLLHLRGCTVRETPVNHRPRRTGTTKYGVANRLWVGLLDTMGVWWLERRWVDPVVDASSDEPGRTAERGR